MHVSIKRPSLMDWMPSRSPRIASVVPAAPPVPRPGTVARPAAPATPAATVPAEATRERWTLADAHRAYGKRMKAENATLADTYEAACERLVKAERLSIHEARGRVNAERPDLRIAYIERMRRSA